LNGDDEEMKLMVVYAARKLKRTKIAKLIREIRYTIKNK